MQNVIGECVDSGVRADQKAHTSNQILQLPECLYPLLKAKRRGNLTNTWGEIKFKLEMSVRVHDCVTPCT